MSASRADGAAGPRFEVESRRHAKEDRVDIQGRHNEGKHRSRLKILADILSVVSGNNGAKKTHIMYQAYLSYKLLVHYLNDITEAGLVKCENGTFYELTTRGKNFLARFTEYSKSREIIKKQVYHIEYQKSTLEEMWPTIEVPDVNRNALESKSDLDLKRGKTL